MSLSASIAITFRKRKRNAPDFAEKERRIDYGKMKRFLYNSIKKYHRVQTHVKRLLFREKINKRISI